MKAYADANGRPDLAAHANCLAERERLDELAYEMDALQNSLANVELADDLSERISVVTTYLCTGFWEGCDFLPDDGITAEVQRLKAAVVAAGHTLPSSSQAGRDSLTDGEILHTMPGLDRRTEFKPWDADILERMEQMRRPTMRE